MPTSKEDELDKAIEKIVDDHCNELKDDNGIITGNVLTEEAVHEIKQLILAREEDAAKRAIDNAAASPTRMRSTSNRTKAKALHDKGYGYGKIGRIMGVGKSTVQYWLQSQLKENKEE